MKFWICLESRLLVTLATLSLPAPIANGPGAVSTLCANDGAHDDNYRGGGKYAHIANKRVSNQDLCEE
jgi:hypothetical protein